MKKIECALVYGAGMMGKNIALVLTSSPNTKVLVYDIYPVDIKEALKQNFMPFIERGILTQEQVDERISRVSFISELNEDTAKEIDLVIECVFEKMELKREVFAFLESVCREDTLFCTNTSVMSPTEISQSLKHKERFMGTHFWNPAHLIPLVEVVKSLSTLDEAAESVIEFLAGCGKTPVLCKKDVPGFIANRMQHALWREAISIVENGIADAKTVDLAVKNSFGLRLPQLGPLENADLAGVDLTYNIHDYVLQYLESSPRPSSYLENLKDNNYLGFKTNKGFYDWTDDEKSKVSSDLNEYLYKKVLEK